MIMYREWVVKKTPEESKWNNQPWKMSGWFLFGVVPIYVRRRF